LESASHLPEQSDGFPAESLVGLLLGILSIAALLWYYAHNDLLLYGDAVAHINIARRVIDNRSWLSSFFQLGTVWLPLQHVAMLPFVWNNRLWQSGIAGSIPSMVAYVLGGLGIFRLMTGVVPTPSAKSADKGGAPISRLVPAIAATAIYALNPNLLYLQTTAMNEPIYMAFFVWALVYLQEALRANPERAVEPQNDIAREQALERCGICLAGGAWTRYDGWFAAAIILPVIVILAVRWLRNQPERSRRRALTKSLIEILLLNALVPAFWLAYNHRVSGRAMDWANGPYSAKAIAERTTKPDAPPYPGRDHPITAAQYFLKAAQLNVGGESDARVVLVFAACGSLILLRRFRQYWVWLLLWLPLIFYAFSIAYGSVPIFIPAWWPFSYYNVRYGLELLPVFAVFPVVFTTNLGLTRASKVIWWGVLILLISICYAGAWKNTPITLREARANSRTRVAMEEGLADSMVRLPKGAPLLMYESSHVGALQRAGIPLKNVISESSHPDWEWALLDPAHKADYIIGCQGDPVWMASREHRSELDEIVSISVPGQERCTIYRPSVRGASPQTP